MKFFELSPWSDYSILETDYDNYSVVYACDTFYGGALKFDWLWVITRAPFAIGSVDHTTMKEKVFGVIGSELEHFGDPATRLRPTQQTTAEGCVYSKHPVGKF